MVAGHGWNCAHAWRKKLKIEIEEQRRVEEERQKRHQEIAAQEEKGAVYCVGSNDRGRRPYMRIASTQTIPRVVQLRSSDSDE
jgi:hypothetical protein